MVPHEIKNPNLRFGYDSSMFEHCLISFCSNFPIPVLCFSLLPAMCVLLSSDITNGYYIFLDCWVKCHHDRVSVLWTIDRQWLCYKLFVFNFLNWMPWSHTVKKAKVLNSLTGLLALGRKWHEPLRVLYSPTNSNLQ